ncbi:MAG: ABC transporter substrate-binding protein [Piscinibacter sp.]|uniref:ABC transporter substrate-binding protein n=1 Tax=Piscinibacter TaxID=1114981 RepID=UPI000FDDFE0E|nr:MULTISPECIES: ABC transporter substrate-binding protein [Piscinibacter]MCW5667522.1 ABC transporter substrate-binding protein [Piscinibacter sp.]
MRLTSLLGALVATALLSGPALADTKLRVFVGGSGQRPDLMRKLFDQYQAKHPGVTIESETGGATSELQRQYLSTVLNAKDSTLDIYMVDIVNPAQYAGAGWLEPLNAYVGEPAAAMKSYLPAYAAANVIDGKVAALPAFADAMFMYYRKDLLEKHKIAEPKTWDELAAAAKKIQTAESAAGNPNLQGLSIQGAPIEGAVCTFLLPYWSQGKEFNDAGGRLTLDKGAAVKGLEQWLAMVDQGVIKKNVAEVKTPDTVNEFKAGQVVFAINWGFAWDRFSEDKDSKVVGKVGVMPLPAVAGGKSATCIGGWQWAVSAFSKNKAEAAKLVQFLASPEASKLLAVEGSLLPTSAAVYADPEVLKAVPWFKDAAAVVGAGRSRPQSRDYGQVSDVIRTTTSAVLARTKKADEGVAEIESRLRRVMR